jgi:hypothetical protein
MKHYRFFSTAIVSIATTATIRRIVIASSIGSNNSATSSAFVDISTSGRITQPRKSSLHTTSSGRSVSEAASPQQQYMIDPMYPGTAVERLQTVHLRVAELANMVPPVLNGPWETVRQKLLWAGGLRDLPDAIPGQVGFIFPV